MDQPAQARRRALLGWALLGMSVLGAGFVVWLWLLRPPPPLPEVAVPAPPPRPVEASFEQVERFCGACHAYPPPETFPRSAWRKQIRDAYDFFRHSSLQTDCPSLESVALYYEKRAPEQLPRLRHEPPPTPLPLRLERVGYSLKGQPPHPGVTNVALGRLFNRSKGPLDVVVCDARLGQVLALQPYTSPPAWHVLGRVPAPAHAEVVDLDGDGINDVLVADLGSFAGTDDRVGRVVWLRGSADGKFTPFTLLEGVGRVADVRAADFRKVGKKDLVVAAFGWHETGATLYLENQTTDWAKPVFVTRVLDERPGGVHVEVGDVNNDGRPDIVALISQEHETIVAFINEGKGLFRKETIWTAPHPAYGSSGIQLVDLNNDGALDILYTNGDFLDPPFLLKPYHGVQWLENPGRFPFRHHSLTSMYGVMRACAADFRGTGRKDIVAVSCLPPELFPQRAKLDLDAVVYLEQAQAGRFIRHTLAKKACDHFTCVAGDVYGDGRVHLITGNFCWSKSHRIEDAVVIHKNLGPTRSSAAEK
jgi:hypothetical protein